MKCAYIHMHFVHNFSKHNSLPSLDIFQSLPFLFVRDVTICKEKTIAYLVRSSPISFILLQHPFPEHGHYLWKLLVRERGLSQFLHHCPLKSNPLRIINSRVFHEVNNGKALLSEARFVPVGPHASSLVASRTLASVSV